MKALVGLFLQGASCFRLYRSRARKWPGYKKCWCQDSNPGGSVQCLKLFKCKGRDGEEIRLSEMVESWCYRIKVKSHGWRLKTKSQSIHKLSISTDHDRICQSQRFRFGRGKYSRFGRGKCLALFNQYELINTKVRLWTSTFVGSYNSEFWIIYFS